MNWFFWISPPPREGRSTTLEMVSRVADQVFMPFTVGGGIREVKDMRRLLTAGADKISVNSAAVRNPEILGEGADVLAASVLYWPSMPGEFRAG